MPRSCPHAQQWLRSTFHQWLQQIPGQTPSAQGLARHGARCVSTTSAINRGLRAEQGYVASFGGRERRGPRSTENGRSARQNYGLQDALAVQKNRVLAQAAAMTPTRPSTKARLRVNSGDLANRERSRFQKRAAPELQITKHGARNTEFPGAKRERARLRILYSRKQAEADDANEFGRDSFIDDGTSGKVDQDKTQSPNGNIRKHGARQTFRDTKSAYEGLDASVSSKMTRRERLLNAEQRGRPGRDKAVGDADTTTERHVQDNKSFRKHGTAFNRIRDVQFDASDNPRVARKKLEEQRALARSTRPSNYLLDLHSSQAPQGEVDTGPSPLSHSDKLVRQRYVEETSKDYQDLYPMLRVLQIAETSSSSGSQNTRETLASQLSEMVESLKSVSVGARRSVLRHLLGDHTTISSVTDKKKDYMWTKGGIRPRKMPKSIIWMPKTVGPVELVLADVHKADQAEKKRHESLNNTETTNASDKNQQIKVESKHRKFRDSSPVVLLRGIVLRCRDLISSVQEAQRGRRVTLEDEDDEQVKTRITELQQCVTTLNTNFLESNAIQGDDVRKALTAVLGPPGRLWTRQHRDGRFTRLWFNDRNGHVELLRKMPLESKANTQFELKKDVSHVKVDQITEEEAAPREEDESVHRRSKGNSGPAWEEVKNWVRSQNGSDNSRGSGLRGVRSSTQDDMPRDIPISVPRTTAASTFVYGVNAVLAALSAKKRQLYHLYIDTTKSSDFNRDQILSLAQEAGMPITSNASKRLLDRMANGRPHNGIILEASQVPAPPTLGLDKPNLQAATMPLQLDRQNAEDKAINGAPSSLPILTDTWRYPFILMLDGILDEGNLGNILRTAYFYGVDAVAVSKNTCASINSSIVAKASSGAVEAVQILSLPAPSKFVHNSLRASWRVYAAVAPPLQIPASESSKWLTQSKVADSSPLRDFPCILMLGAEGEGLRENLKSRADHFVSIEQGARPGMAGGLLPGIGVDSMNVGSAAGVLIESFMRKPADAPSLTADGTLGF